MLKCQQLLAHLTFICMINAIYQSPLILIALFQHNLINVSYLTACYLYQVIITLHFCMTSLMTQNQHKNKKLRHNRLFEECLTMGKLINRILGSRLLISSLPGSALKTHVESLGKPRDVNKRSQSLPGKLDIKRHSPSILYI